MRDIKGYNQTLDLQLSVLREILFKSEAFIQIFETAPMLKLPNWYVGAGFISQTVWNALSGFPLLQNIKDVDLVYFDNDDLTEEGENKTADMATQLFKGLPIEFDVINQARVHVWYEGYFGYPIAPYQSVEAAINTWPTTATATAIRNENGEFKVYAPFGLNDLLGMIARPNKVQITEEIYLTKVNRWKTAWPNLKVVSW